MTWFARIFWTLVGALLMWGIADAAPPENANPAFKQWFQSKEVPEAYRALNRQLPMSCCDAADGRAVDIRYLPGGKIQAYVDDRFPSHVGDPPEWVDIPEASFVRGDGNPTGRPVLWYSKYYGGVLCFAMPPET